MMPLFVKDFTWRQTPETIVLTVPIKGVRRDKTSFVTADNYIRVHFQPYYFEVFLWGEIDDEHGKCTLDEKSETVIFEMPKLSSGQEWPALDVKDLPKMEKHEKRNRAVELSQRRTNAEIEAALARRHEQRQMTIHEQIRLDDEARARIAGLKGFYTKSVMEQYEEWKATNEQGGGDTTKASSVPALNSAEDSAKPKSSTTEKPSSATANPSSGPKSTVASTKAASGAIWTNQEIKKADEQKKPAPPVEAPIRAESKISVSFTAREFPTPSRESTAAEEEEWLKKQVEARRTSGFNDADLRPEENNPTWLYEKGESLMKTGSYLGAISAYSTGLKLAPKMPELYCGRASAHLALSNIRKAVEDASQALELLTPKVPQNVQDRLRSHRTRGQGLLKLKLKKEAMDDFREAHRLDPDDAEITETLAQLQAALDKAELFGESSDSD